MLSCTAVSRTCFSSAPFLRQGVRFRVLSLADMRSFIILTAGWREGVVLMRELCSGVQIHDTGCRLFPVAGECLVWAEFIMVRGAVREGLGVGMGIPHGDAQRTATSACARQCPAPQQGRLFPACVRAPALFWTGGGRCDTGSPEFESKRVLSSSARSMSSHAPGAPLPPGLDVDFPSVVDVEWLKPRCVGVDRACALTGEVGGGKDETGCRLG